MEPRSAFRDVAHGGRSSALGDGERRERVDVTAIRRALERLGRVE
jgi:hypothetical protein